MQGFVIRLIPPRATFSSDMNDDERAVMARHVEYWTAHMQAGRVLAFGPVADRQGPYGLGLVLAHDPAAVDDLLAADPALVSIPGMRAEVAPMPRLVTPSGIHP